MIVPGYTEIFRKDGVIVFDLQHATVPSSLVACHNISGLESYSLPIDPLRRPFEDPSQNQSRRGRRRRNRQKSKKNCIILELDGHDVEVEGFVYADTFSKLAHFFVNHMKPRANKDDDFENWWFLNQHGDRTPQLIAEAERQLIKVMNYRYEHARQNLDNLFVYEGYDQNWYFEEGAYQSAFVEEAELKIGDYTIPRVHFVSIDDTQCIAFDGKQSLFFPLDGREANQIIGKLEKAKVYESASLDPLALTHLDVVSCLRIPTLEEYENSGISTLDDPPLLSSDGPQYGYLYDPQMPISIPDPQAITMIDDLEEVIALLARTDHGVLIGDRTPEFPSKLIFTDQPSFMLLALPRGCDAL